MPQVRFQILSDRGPLLDEPVDAAIIKRYQELASQGMDGYELIRALWAEDFDTPPTKAKLIGHAPDGRRVNIEIPTRSGFAPP